MMKIPTLILTALLVVSISTNAQSKKTSFQKDVMPLISAKCLPCHGTDSDNPSKLSLESYKEIMAGGRHGVIVIPGKPDSSLMIKKLRANPPFGEQMPLLKKVKLTPEEIAVFENWIKDGAKKK
jgi:uncharacterized membrane protein